MPENVTPLESINYPRVFPWVHLFRAFWIAIDVRKLLLAAAGLLVMSTGTLLLDRLPFAPHVAVAPLNAPGSPWWRAAGNDQPGADFVFADPPRAWKVSEIWQQLLRTWQLKWQPLNAVLEPAARLFTPHATWAHIAYETTRLLWALAVWAFFGGAIGRMAAVEFARDQRVSARHAVIFAASNFFGYLSAPLLPLAGVSILWGICAAGGTATYIPLIGPALVGLFWGIGLLLGFLITIVLIGVAIGWPIMFATINVEGTDGFDGLSRGYNYVFERPWQLLWYATVALVHGTIMLAFVSLMVQLMAFFAASTVAWGVGDATAGRVTAGAAQPLATPPLPTATASAAPRPDGGSPAADPAPGIDTVLISIWMRALAVFVNGFIASYFWTTTTIIYFLLRRSVDANDLDEVFFEEEEQPDDLLPLVGTAAEVPAPPAAHEPPEPPQAGPSM